MPLDLTVSSDLFLALAPDLVVMAGAMGLLLVGVWRRDGDAAAARTVGPLAMGVVLAALAVVAWMAARGPTDAVGPLAVDNFRWAVDGVVLVGALLSLALATDYGRRHEPLAVESFALMLLATSGMMLLAGARDLILIFLGIELMSIPTYVLAGINRRSARSAEAALKYFLLGAFSTAFLLMGVALVYGATGTTHLVAIGQRLAQVGSLLPGPMLGLGVGLMLVGFAFKVAAAPFHMWTPDVYDGAPTPFTAFMAVAVKAAAFAAFARVFLEAFGGVGPRWHPVVWWIAVLTMVGGNLVALAQRDVKRILAYSSIAHAGYLLVAIATRTGRSATAVPFYLLAYTLATVGAFAVIQAVAGGAERGVDLARFRGLFAARPWLAAAMAVFMLALLGFPLAGGMGFMGKWYLVQTALATPAPQTRLVVVLVLASVVSAGYYLRVVAEMFMRPRAADAGEMAAPAGWTRGVIIASAIALLFFGVYPTWAVDASLASELTVAGPAAVMPNVELPPGGNAALAPAPAAPATALAP